MEILSPNGFIGWLMFLLGGCGVSALTPASPVEITRPQVTITEIKESHQNLLTIELSSLPIVKLH